GTEDSLRKCTRDFDGVEKAADEFVAWANGILQEQDECDLEVQTALPEKRVRKKKSMPGEVAQDEPVSDAERNYKIKAHNVILDTVAYSVDMQPMQCCALTLPMHIIGLGYKFLLTLSVTQVACERTFSTLTFVKNRLRTSMTQDRLEAFLLMSTEKEILMGLDIDNVIDKVAETSELMRRQLTF
ncbi:hypothetical protein JOQ06_023643, partial [Pogonophryne albipinna]